MLDEVQRATWHTFVRLLRKKYHMAPKTVKPTLFYDPLDNSAWIHDIDTVVKQNKLRTTYPIISSRLLHYTTDRHPVHLKPSGPIYTDDILQQIFRDFQTRSIRNHQCYRNALKCGLLCDSIKYIEGFVWNPYYNSGIGITQHAWIRLEYAEGRCIIDFDPTFFYRDQLGRYFQYYYYLCHQFATEEIENLLQRKLQKLGLNSIDFIQKN